MTRKQYKKIKEYEKRFNRRFDDLRLINLLINLKSNGYNIYNIDRIRLKLRYILKGEKTWEGDVKKWVLDKYFSISLSPIFDTRYYGECKIKSNQKYNKL